MTCNLFDSIPELAKIVDERARIIFRAKSYPDRVRYILAVRINHDDHVHTWHCTNARTMLEVVLPYLERRKDDAALVVNHVLWSVPNPHVLTPEIKARWDEALVEAKRRGR